jgi:predicted ATP-grasp superfamily ATP-dependent carboligase
VETIDDPEVRSMAQAILDRLHYTGLVEIEFKRDPRDGEPKLLDINPRLWGWHTLGRRAGMDFAYLNWKLVYGECPPHIEAPAGVRWVWPAADIPTAVREVAGRRLRIRDYLRAFRAPVDLATLAIDDPLPGLMEIPMHGLESVRRWMRASAGASPRTSGLPNRLRQNGSAKHTPWIRAAIRLGTPRAVRRNSDRGARP